MKSYPSIETIFTRDANTHKLNWGRLRMPEIDTINEWEITEKIDGTNIRVTYTLNGVEIKGRTDKANLASDVIIAVNEAIPHHPVAVEYFTGYRGKELPEQWSVTFYGEAYGPGIQKGGVYSNEKRFRCFDLLLGESWWCHGFEMRDICKDLGIPTVPFLGTHVLGVEDLESRLGCEWFMEDVITESFVAFEDKGVSNIEPEGIVAKPPLVLLDRHGDRIMWKLTNREFR